MRELGRPFEAGFPGGLGHFDCRYFPATMDAVKPTIFVVEDDADISRLVRHHLEGAGFNERL